VKTIFLNNLGNFTLNFNIRYQNVLFRPPCFFPRQNQLLFLGNLLLLLGLDLVGIGLPINFSVSSKILSIEIKYKFHTDCNWHHWLTVIGTTG